MARKAASMSTHFWDSLDALVRRHVLVIDRPRHTPHPHFPESLYPFDYGYLMSTTGGDGQGVDVWRGSQPTLAVTGAVCTLDLAKGDVELKLLIGCQPWEMEQIYAFHNQGEQAALLLVRPPG